MDRPLRLHTWNELPYLLSVLPCTACGKGPMSLTEDGQEAPEPGRRIDARVRCGVCDARRTLAVLCDEPVGEGWPACEEINPTDEPSRVVDLAQWLALFYTLIEQAAGRESRAETRSAGFRAALCLDEALKFYEPDSDLPPESAFFHDASVRAYRRAPEKYTRQRLRDMKSKLPALDAMAARVAADRRSPRRPWWRFWRRG